MHSPHDRDRETAQLIERFRAAAARRRRMRIILGCALGIVVVAAALVVTLVLTSSDSEHAVTTSTSIGSDLAGTLASTLASTSTAPPTTYTTATSSTVQPTGQSATTSAPQPETTSTGPTTATSAYIATRYVVVLDPGHQAKADSGQEPIGPGSSTTKDRVSSGTKSINTGSPESELVLKVALKLRDSLRAEGIEVVMTRTTQEVWISNMERAQIANTANADLFVRVHADGATDTSIHGILMLYPASIEGWTDDIASESKRAAQLALDHLVATTGAKNRGMVARKDITGFNWSDVPVILPEIGLMTNKTEDALLATDAYQDKIVQGLCSAITEYLGVR